MLARDVSAHYTRATRFASPSSRHARHARPRASSDSTGSTEVEVVRFGIGRGSSATYSPSATTNKDGVIDPRSTTYADGALDALAISLFNAKLAAVVGEEASASANEKRGFERLVALADALADGRTVVEQRAAVTRALLSIIPAPVRFLFKKMIKPAPWVDEMNAYITREAFAWLVGPCEVMPRESDGVMAQVKLRKCRYLEQSGCSASCANFCKIPTQRFFKEAFGVDARLDPNHEDGSCVMTFGVKPDINDAAFAAPCYNSCAKGCGTRDAPCHRLGEQPEF